MLTNWHKNQKPLDSRAFWILDFQMVCSSNFKIYTHSKIQSLLNTEYSSPKTLWKGIFNLYITEKFDEIWTEKLEVENKNESPFGIFQRSDPVYAKPTKQTSKLTMVQIFAFEKIVLVICSYNYFRGSSHILDKKPLLGISFLILYSFSFIPCTV